MRNTFSAFLLGAVCVLSACSAPEPIEPTRVLPDAPEPTAFTRAYSMTEAPDGIRVYVQEDGDTTEMKFIRPVGNGWSEPELVVDLPTRRTLTGPHFSRFDEMFYFSTDATIPEREGGRDLNIWRAEYLGEGRFGEAEPLPLVQINTGANETASASTRDGLFLFVTNHSRGGTGSYDIMQAREVSEGEWSVETLPEGINDRQTNDHLAMDPDGDWIILVRGARLGSGNQQKTWGLS